MQGQEQVLLHSLGGKLVRHPVAVDGVDVRGEEQTVGPVINQDGCILMAGEMDYLELTVAQIEDIALINQMHLVPSVGTSLL